MDPSVTIASLLGSKCTNFRLIAGGSLILYLHNSAAERTRPIECTLHIEPAWRFHGNSHPLMGSFDTPPDNNDVDHWISQLQKLCGLEIQDIHIGDPVRDLTIQFTDGYAIRTFANSVTDGENWELRFVNGGCLGMASGDICSLTQSDSNNKSDTIQ